jgi:glycosyl transferase family 25
LQLAPGSGISGRMRIYLINLARRPDRLATMAAQAERLGLDLARIEAVDAWITEPDARFDIDGPLGEIPRGDQCCTLSHVKAWEMFVASGEAYAAVLEDDVVLSPGAGFVLKDSDWIPAGIGLLKLEHYGPMSQSVLLSDFRDVGGGFQVARMHSRHTGAAAYILSRAAAQMLLAVTRFNLPVDHLLFNPNNSPLFPALSPWQLLPAVARQQAGDKSDIEGWRVGMRKLSATYVKRELIRFGYDLKLLPKQIALLLSGRAKFVRITEN